MEVDGWAFGAQRAAPLHEMGVAGNVRGSG
jgi:hypothetical protein